MKQEQDNYCYLFTLASTNKATQATLKTLHTTLFHSWATATLLKASLPLPLLVKFNSSATASLLNKNSSELSLPLFATATFAGI